jgi:HD-GYP domain-containing protein (c-di-GMP phosphodiesterase class II)
VSYFLGAVVPLATLAYVAHTYVLPSMEEDRAARGLVALLVSVGVLSLASFLVLRRVARQSLSRLDTHGKRLETLLAASRSVALAPYGAEVCRAAVGYALPLTRARAAFVLMKGGKEADAQLEGEAGEEAGRIFGQHEASLQEALELVGSGGGFTATSEDGPWRGEGTPPAALAAAPIVSGDEVQGVLLAVDTEAGRRFGESELSALSTLAALVSVSRHNAEMRDSERNFFVHSTEILVTALDASMDVQRGHARRVAYFSGAVGRELALDEGTLERLHFASLLHDIGMLRIDTATASKAVYKQHPALGHRMLRPIRVWEHLAPLVLHHHEWFDGRGYPEGLSGEAIPIESRIIAVAEAFDSMTSAKSYREPVSIADALAEIRTGAGTQFDPTVARIFVQLVERGALEIEAAG